MLEDYKHWIPAVRKIMENLQKPDIWALFNHLPASTYYTTKPRICLVGDAAHASTPHQGAGAGMCIEDVHVLSELLSQCRGRDEFDTVFYAYDAARRPRSQRLVKTSKEAGMLWEFEGEDVGDDLESLRKDALERMGWIWDHEISDDLGRARRMMKEGLPNAP
jgi:salicylate hydroxylase